MGTICVRSRRGAPVYQAKVRIKGFPPLSRTFPTRTEAEEWAIEQETPLQERVAAARAIADQRRIAAECAPEYRVFGDLMRRYLAVITPQKRASEDEAIRLRGLLRHSLAACPLQGLTAARVAQWRDERLATVSGSTVNRDMNLLSHVVEIARCEWEIDFEANPFQRVQVHSTARPASDVYSQPKNLCC